MSTKKKRKRQPLETTAVSTTKQPTTTQEKQNQQQMAEKRSKKKNDKEASTSKSQKSPIEKKKKKKVTKVYQTMRNRCSPGSLQSVIEGLSSEQKSCVTEMGFGALLKMKLTEIPGALSFYVLKSFDPKTKKIKLENGEIQVTRESVNEMIGLPLGDINFSDLTFREPEDTTYEQWTNQFQDKNMIRLTEIREKMVSSTQADSNFKMNFIALMINSLCESSSAGKANYAPLNYITSETDIANIDWCSYLIDCLVRTKYSYNESSQTSNFVGPCAYLVLMYVDMVHSDCIEVERTRPTICQWTSEKIKFRETFEKVLDGFGSGQINEAYEQTTLTEMEYTTKFLEKKNKLQSLLEEGLHKYPSNRKFQHWSRILSEINNDDDDHVHDADVNEGSDDDDDDNGDEGNGSGNVEKEQEIGGNNGGKEKEIGGNNGEKEQEIGGNESVQKELERREHEKVENDGGDDGGKDGGNDGGNKSVQKGGKEHEKTLSQFWSSPSLEHLLAKNLPGTSEVLQDIVPKDSFDEAEGLADIILQDDNEEKKM